MNSIDESNTPPGVSQDSTINELLQSVKKIEKEICNASKPDTSNSHSKELLLQLSKGMAFGLGSVLGASVIVSLTVYLLSHVEFIPIIGEWVKNIIQEIQKPGI